MRYPVLAFSFFLFFDMGMDGYGICEWDLRDGGKGGCMPYAV